MAKVFFCGRIVRDCELKVTKNGENLYVVDVAENYKGGTTYYSVTMKPWAEKIVHYLTKGKAVAVSGTLKVSAYISKGGEAKPSISVYADDVQFMSTRAEDAQNALANQTNDGLDESGFVPVSEEELPF